MNIQCSFCHALHWKAEALTSSTINNPLFGMCCYQGKISLPGLHYIPQPLYNLFTANDPISRAFHNHILFYNNSLAMTSTGKRTDYTVNQGGGAPYSYVLCNRRYVRACQYINWEVGHDGGPCDCT